MGGSGRQPGTYTTDKEIRFSLSVVVMGLDFAMTAYRHIGAVISICCSLSST
jgi:hypothetical protein